MKRVSIDPITRLEGHGKIDIFLNDEGEVTNAYLQIPELRGFERFCMGRAAEDKPNLTNRICGVCPEAHHICSAKTLDALFHVDPPPAAKKLREMFYNIFFVTDHTTHFYALAGPDFVVGPDAPPAQRNILGIVAKVGLEIGGKVLKMRRDGHAMIKLIGGRPVHPNWGLPGGVSRGINEEQREEIEKLGRDAIEFAKFSLQLFDDIVLKDTKYKFVDIIVSDAYTHRTYNMGMVDENNHVNFYDGKIRVTGPDGKEHAKYDCADYREYVAERVEPWSYLKFPYLKKVGWKGFVDGEDSGVYKCTPLSRLNAADGMATPLAQAEYERFYETLGGKPVHHTLATNWARLVEILYAAERWVELATDPEITSDEYRVLPTETPTEGVGCVEAPRGTLTHHYATDERGILTKVIVGTTNNNAPICMSVKKAAQGLIQKGQPVKESMLNMVEMAFRAYDPCFGCATHSLPGQMPLEVTIRSPEGEVLQRLSQYVG